MSDPILPNSRLGPLVSYGNAWLAAIIDSSDDAIVSKTLDGIITSWNRGAERIFGYSAEEAVGQHISLIIPKTRLSEEDQVLAAIRQGQRVDHFETMRQTKDGRLIHISLTVSPVRDSEDRIIGVSKVARDISERKRLEEDARVMDRERRAALASEQKARAEAEAINRGKDEFVTTLSHELRTPLNAIFGWVQLLRAGALDETARAHALEVIDRNTRTQTRMVEDLLDVSRIMTGQFRIEPRPVDLATVIAAAVDAVRPAIDAKGLQLVTHLDAAGPVAGDPDRLQQVVWNLLTNAVKFTPRGGRIEVTLERRGSRGGGARLGYRPRDLRGLPAPRLRALQPGGRLDVPIPARPRYRPGARPPPGRAPRRCRRCRERGGGPGRHVHGPAARSRDASGHPRRRRHRRRARAGRRSAPAPGGRRHPRGGRRRRRPRAAPDGVPAGRALR